MGTRGIAGVALLSSGVWFGGDNELPVVKVNEDDSLLSHWGSEDYGAHFDAEPECSFWNMNVSYDGGVCNHFTIGRAASTPTRARERALACAGKYGAECILSPEIGLSLPAAFLYTSHGEDTGTMKMIMGPKLLQHDALQQHVRVSPPTGDGLTSTRTFIFNKTVHVEYLDGRTRAMVTTYLHDADAYCIQLLRVAFEDRCWNQIE